MEAGKARELLSSERIRTQQLLADLVVAAEADRVAADQPGDMFDSAEPLVTEGRDDAIVEELRLHLEAIDRAENRLREGTYGLSVRSGQLIPDERLEADPTAELTVDEAGQSA
jgi:DnaK suppressor protein